MFKVMKHQQNQHGYSVSLTKYEGDELVAGFVLNSFSNEANQNKYIAEFIEITGYEIEEGF